ncbi:putative nad-dependent epimerase dehydratase family protein [Daldinia childiae]|uniref:putative nad-dependent epimerase dehydratase family protein n=1 Tax=Daldinia childiae TaxID=326645 RepID=UPI00144663D9|nr:putative nad-dependent epimerase dehydratase family protein [Daldinia childiae]KAF3070867.1 putative nad-dependent epimerase dehydratase family protein [Daldinia childiae]
MNGKEPLEAPPPYTALPTNPDTQDELQLNSLTSHLQHHITSLPDRIRATQQARKVEQSFSDASLLDHIVPVLEEFLVDLGARHTPVPLATLTLVPSVTVPKNAILSGLEDMKRRGEICRVSRISIERPGKDSKSGSGTLSSPEISENPSWATGQEFSDWGRFDEPSSSLDGTAEKIKSLWWHDEEMARRLANYLQPRKEKRSEVKLNSVVQTVVEQRLPPKKEKKSWFWGKRISEEKSPESTVPNLSRIDAVKDNIQEEQEKQGADMTVMAQEVAFRQENDLGIWESVRGWGIVVTVKYIDVTAQCVRAAPLVDATLAVAAAAAPIMADVHMAIGTPITMGTLTTMDTRMAMGTLMITTPRVSRARVTFSAMSTMAIVPGAALATPLKKTFLHS